MVVVNELNFCELYLLPQLTLNAEETITIVRGDGNYFPFEYVANGKLTGIHIDLI
ncbi:MAG: hypothetical protein ACI89T_000926 [Cognaticolwellia sp.]|jgi:hypothetical protein